MTDSDTMTVYQLAELLARTPIRTVVKPMHRMETVGPSGPEMIETGMIRLELPIPGYVYIRESSYTRHPDGQHQVSFSKATSFVRRAAEESDVTIVDDDGKTMPASGLCALLDTLPHVQNYDLSAFEQPPVTH